MENSEASASVRFALVTRVTALLGRILDNLDRSIQVIAESAEGSQLPYVQGDKGDIELAAMYLRDLGFQYDGKRLHREYWQLINKCIDEWLSDIAYVESQEFQRDQLLELFGQFPSREGPNDPMVKDRRTAILGLAVQFSEFLSELIRSVNASEKQSPDAMNQNSKTKEMESAKPDCVAGSKSPDNEQDDVREDGLYRKDALLIWGGARFEWLTETMMDALELLVKRYPQKVPPSEMEHKLGRLPEDGFKKVFKTNRSGKSSIHPVAEVVGGRQPEGWYLLK